MRLPFVCLVFYIPTAQRICAISSYTDKNSRRSSAKLSACCFACFARKRINEHSFRAHLLTECAYSKCEPQGGENMSAELSSHTSSFCFNHNKLQLFALALCAPLPTRQKTSLSSLIYKHKFACFCRAGALVCVVQATAPCCCAAATQAKWHNKGNVPIYASADCLPRERWIIM